MHHKFLLVIISIVCSIPLGMALTQDTNSVTETTLDYHSYEEDLILIRKDINASVTLEVSSEDDRSFYATIVYEDQPSRQTSDHIIEEALIQASITTTTTTPPPPKPVVATVVVSVPVENQTPLGDLPAYVGTYPTSSSSFGPTCGRVHVENIWAVNNEAATYGWSEGAEWNAIVWIIDRESDFCETAQNPGSTAYGIGQFLNSTWAGVGIAKTDDPVLQARAVMIYISGRYGTPSSAKAFKVIHGWY